ncbi:MAG: hypothetical protein K2N27_09595 [Ruminococcus sp.]|nr:hypothetical protein [Ruminococcus sp.]
MRKIVIISVMTAFLCGFTACGDKTNSSAPESSSVATESSSSETTESADTATTTEQTTESAIVSETTTSVTKQTTTTVSAENIFQQTDISDGIVFSEDVENLTDDALISVAQLLFESACKTEWDFTVGSPYELDTTQTAQNMYGWNCYLITTDGINSLDDIRADYHKIFSESYSDRIDEVFTESGGRVYCLNGARGADIFYEKSVVTAVNSRSDNEISFTVENYYNGDDFGNDAYISTEDFVITIDSDGAWRVLKFRLPY